MSWGIRGWEGSLNRWVGVDLFNVASVTVTRPGTIAESRLPWGHGNRVAVPDWVPGQRLHASHLPAVMDEHEGMAEGGKVVRFSSSVVGCDCGALGEVSAPRRFVFPSVLDGSLRGWAGCAGLVLSVVRAYGGGVEKGLAAELTGVDPGHIDQALAWLEDEGYVQRRVVSVPWYYSSRNAVMWLEKPHPALIGKPFPRFVRRRTTADRLPPQFWWMFWSGLDPMLIRLPDHAWYVASRMITPDDQRRNLPAETWALKHLPPTVLGKLVSGPGFADTEVKDRIEWVLNGTGGV